MLIGKLNQKLQDITCVVTKKDVKNAPAILENGNPFLGEPLRVDWNEIMTTGLDLHVTIPEGYMLNTVVVHLGEKCNPTAVSVYSENKTMLLYTYEAETGKTITDPIVELPVNEDISKFVIEFSVAFTSINVPEIELYGADLSGIKLFPVPQEVTPGDGSVRVASFATYSADSVDAKAAAAILTEKFQELTGKTLNPAENGNIQFVFDGSVAENGYRLSIAREKTTITASDLRGFVMGVENFLKLIDGDAVPACDIKDAPFMEFRGVHLFMPSMAQMDFAKRLIKYILSPSGYNYVILEMGASMRFDSHPEVNAAFAEAVEKGNAGLWPKMPHGGVAGGTVLEKDQVRDFAAYVRSFGIEVIPEVQSLGHVQYLTLAHPDIAERAADGKKEETTDARVADIPPSDFYAHSCCPSNPKTYEILFDMLDELIEVLQPKKYVHMGHDEVYQIGICPICKDKDPAELYAQDVIKFHDHLAEKGLQMMIWSDMIQPVTRYKTPPAIDMIPKDIVMLDFIWYFHPELDIEENLLAKGFKVAYGNMYSSHFTRFEKRIRKDGVLGGQPSAWVQTSEHDLAKEGKLYDFLFTANMLWSEAYRGYNRYAYDRLLKAKLPELRSALQNCKYPSQMPGAKEICIADKGRFDPAAECGGTFPVNQKADSLVIDHATTLQYRRFPWVDLEEIGAYEVRYCDGSKEMIPVTYGGNISHWNRRQNEPFRGGYYRHNGYSGSWFTDGAESRLADGRIATVYRYEWRNPHPGLAICEITYVPAENAETQVIVNRLSVIGG